VLSGPLRVASGVQTGFITVRPDCCYELLVSVLLPLYSMSGSVLTLYAETVV
jgi:hypothetical protein